MRFPVRVAAPLVSAALIVSGCLDIASLVSEPPAASPATVPTPVPTPVLTRPAPTPEPTFLIYQVKPGDALTAIAKRFRTTVASIGYWNRARYGTLDPDSSAYAPDAIKIGWLLRIHPGQTTDGDFEEPTVSPATPESPDASPAASPSGSPRS